MAHIGILGGTFNPPHVGHLVCAQEAGAALGLDEVRLMPVATPPHKTVSGDPGAAHRVAMCEVAIAGDDGLSVSTAEVDRGGVSYTVDTLRELHECEPEHDLTFIAGGDMAAGLVSWREPRAVLELARFAVAERGEDRREQITAALEPLGGTGRVAFFEIPRMDISSSAVRDRVVAGRPIRYLVPDAVAAYIVDHGLYRGDGETA